MPLRLGGKSFQVDPTSIVFFLALFAGNLILADGVTGILYTIFFLVLNQAQNILWQGLPYQPDRLELLVFKSLFSLAVFPLLWLAAVLIAKTNHTFFLGVILILVCFASGIFGRRVESENKMVMAIPPVLLLVLLLTYWPFKNLGKGYQGNQSYRAYFSSDYLKHFSVVEVLNRSAIPPANPYFAGQPLHYYWLIYAVPAFMARLGGSTEMAVRAWSFTIDFLFLLLLVVVLSRIYRRGRWLPYFISLLVFTSSLEGLYFFISRCHWNIQTFFQLGQAMNIDALTRWWWHLPQIDTLLRSLLYTPQHLLAICYALILCYWIHRDLDRPWLISGILVFSLLASFFIGCVLLLAWGIYFISLSLKGLWISKKMPVHLGKDILRGFAFPVLTVGLFILLKMVVFRKSMLVWEWPGLGPAAVLLGLNFGLLFLTGWLGMAIGKSHLRRFGLTLIALALVFILFLRMEGFESDFSLKVGLLVLLLLVFFSAVLLERIARPWLRILIFMALFVPGLFTPLLDVVNTTDITNRAFTAYVPLEEKNVLRWLKKNLPENAVVQTFPPAREANLSLVPTFAGRSMYVGDRMHGQIFQIPETMYDERIDRLSTALRNLPQSREQLKKMGIDYLFWGKPEYEFFKFYPRLKSVFRSGQTILYSLN